MFSECEITVRHRTFSDEKEHLSDSTNWSPTPCPAKHSISSCGSFVPSTSLFSYPLPSTGHSGARKLKISSLYVDIAKPHKRTAVVSYTQLDIFTVVMQPDLCMWSSYTRLQACGNIREQCTSYQTPEGRFVSWVFCKT